eukprot:gene12641-biopygen6459
MGDCGRHPFKPVRQGIRALRNWVPAAGPPSSQCARASELFRNGRLRPAPLQASAPGHQSSSEMGACGRPLQASAPGHQSSSEMGAAGRRRPFLKSSGALAHWLEGGPAAGAHF